MTIDRQVLRLRSAQRIRLLIAGHADIPFIKRDVTLSCSGTVDVRVDGGVLLADRAMEVQEFDVIELCLAGSVVARLVTTDSVAALDLRGIVAIVDMDVFPSDVLDIGGPASLRPIVDLDASSFRRINHVCVFDVDVGDLVIRTLAQ